MKKNLILVFNTFFTISFLPLISCQKKTSSNLHGENQIKSMEQEGIYHAILQPVQKSIAQKISSSLTLVKEKGEVRIHVRFLNGAPQVMHEQNIYLGNRCPKDSDDLNQDGFIDAIEGQRVFKEIILPLDDDISSQRMGSGTFPVTNDLGSYLWSRSSSISKLFKDLYEPDINLSDQLSKLDPITPFSFKDKIVVIHGVSGSESLPDTVASFHNKNPMDSLPVACGVINPLLTIPGKIDSDSSSLPFPAGDNQEMREILDDGADLFENDSLSPGNYGDEHGN